jgi:hypothetical protein
VIAILAGAGRQLLAHWPAIMAWFLAGVLANYVLIQLAGTVGAYSAIGGALILPLAILARLVSYVAMFLVVRDGMRRLDAIAPLPESAAERRRSFLNALLGSILPFVAFYAAWGLLADDMKAYYQRVLELGLGDRIAATIDGTAQSGDGQLGQLDLGLWSIVLLVVAFALRWLLKRYASRLPKASVFAAVYFEVLWVFLAATLIGTALGAVGEWVASRQAMVWLAGIREWVSAQLVPVAWVWEAIEWVLGEAGGVILLPLAWLTIAGVVYGQAVAPTGVRMRGAVADHARRRWAGVPGWLRSRLTDVWDEIVSRFQPIGRALVLMWRAGPVLIGGYVLLYTLLLGLESLVGIGITRIVGPHDVDSFWMVNDQLILLAIPLIIEPLRIVLVSSSYDSVIGRLRQGSTASLSTDGSAPAAAKSTSNGPVASSGTRKSTDSV